MPFQGFFATRVFPHPADETLPFAPHATPEVSNSDQLLLCPWAIIGDGDERFCSLFQVH